MTKAIYFDMDGTIANLYGVDNWLEQLLASNPAPYKQAKVLIDMRVLARLLNKLQRKGYHIGVVSWLSKNGTTEYNNLVTQAKHEWLAKHLHSVKFNEIKVVKYGTPKSTVVEHEQGILFDDEQPNRTEWKGTAYNEKNIVGVLKNLLQKA